MDGFDRNLVHVSDCTWEVAYFKNGVEKIVRVDIIAPGSEIIIHAACYPPALVAFRKKSRRRVVILDLDDLVETKKEDIAIARAPKCKRESIDQRTEESLERFIDFITEVPGLANSYASFCAMFTQKYAVFELIECYANLNPAKIKGVKADEATVIAQEILASDTHMTEMAKVASMAIASFSSSFDFITHGAEDRADLYHVIASYSYSDASLMDFEAPERKAQKEIKMSKNPTLAEVNAFTLRMMEEGKSDDSELDSDEEEDIDEEFEVNEDLGIIGETRVDDMNDVLGVTGLMNIAAIVSTKPVTNDRLMRYYVGKGTHKSFSEHTGSIKHICEVFAINSATMTQTLAQTVPISESRVTAADITNSHEGIDGMYVSRALREAHLASTVISHSTFKSIIEESREQVVVEAEDKGRVIINAPHGRIRITKVKSSSDYKARYLRAVSENAEVTAMVRKMKDGAYLHGGRVVDMDVT
jgi:hypothetical protein